MNIRYDNTLKIAGIGVHAWSRLGPEKWFPEYGIASLFSIESGVEGAPRVRSLESVAPNERLSRINTAALLSNSSFQELLKDSFEGYRFLTYRPVKKATAISDRLINPLDIYGNLAERLENKAEFRRIFSGMSTLFAPYRILEKTELFVDGALSSILDGSDAVILQDATLSGGTGTFLVSSEESLQRALEKIRKSSSHEVVVSKLIDGARDRSVQCVVSKYGVFFGPIQRQIISNEFLINTKHPGVEKFCGIVIDDAELSADQRDSLAGIASSIGETMQEMGYRGIFGIDFLIGADQKIYILEVNPRITGATPLLMAMYGQGVTIPFYLIHILEILNADYSIDDTVKASIPSVQPQGSLLIVHSRADQPVDVATLPRTGVYDKDMNFLSATTDFSVVAEGQYMIQRLASPGRIVNPGERMLNVFYKGAALDESDQLTEKIMAALEDLYGQIITKEGVYV